MGFLGFRKTPQFLQDLATMISLIRLHDSRLNILLLGLEFYAWVKFLRGHVIWVPLIHLLVVCLLDMLEHIFGLSVWSREDSTITMYNWIIFHGASWSTGIDLGFNYYNGDYSKTPTTAQRDKFEHAWSLLGLKEGMRILDCGCGYGDWMAWLKHTKKCTVWGINVSKEQQTICLKRGLPCVLGDWQSIYKDEQRFKELRGKFDAVTFWDTVEHYVKSGDIYACGTEAEEHAVRKRVYGEMFRMAEDLIDPKSSVGKVWVSCLHQTHSLNNDGWYAMFQIFIMVSLYDGIYPKLPGGLSQFASLGGFKLTHEEDRTEDYRMTSILNRSHFGWVYPRFTPTTLAAFLIGLLIDPHALVLYLDLLRSFLGKETAWMWHIGGISRFPKPGAFSAVKWQLYSRQ